MEVCSDKRPLVCNEYDETKLGHVCVMVTARHILHTGSRTWAGILNRERHDDGDDNKSGRKMPLYKMRGEVTLSECSRS